MFKVIRYGFRIYFQISYYVKSSTTPLMNDNTEIDWLAEI